MKWLKKKLLSEQLVITWRKNLEAFISKFFSQFRTERLTVPFSSNEAEKLATYGINDNMMYSWIDETSIELTGLLTDIKIVQNSLNKENINHSHNNGVKKLSNETEKKIISSEKVDSKTSSEETFQISDLKWFQTKMLFERKYFQFVSETYQNLAVMIDTNLTRIWYTGKKQDIEDAKRLAFDILDKILGIEVEVDKKVLKRMTEKENELMNLLKKNGFCCIVDTKSDDNKYTIYGITREEIGKCKYFLDELSL